MESFASTQLLRYFSSQNNPTMVLLSLILPKRNDAVPDGFNQLNLLVNAEHFCLL